MSVVEIPNKITKSHIEKSISRTSYEVNYENHNKKWGIS